jgi:uracil-DNA glycosylase
MNAIHDLFTNQAITLASATDLAGFRQHARRLLANQIAPGQVSWHCLDARTPDLFANPADAAPDAPDAIEPVNDRPRISVPPDFLALCQTVILHRDPRRFGLMYRLLWRLVHEPGLRHDTLDADHIFAQHLAQAVRRDIHKMKAFVRFRTLEDEAFKTRPLDGPLHVAWFEPEHHIVEAIAPFFTRRFTQMRWAIMTPERCVAWDGATATFSPGAHKDDAPPPDAGEQLWLTYYQHIFNPARLKLKMMQKEMPRRYWHNLPEAQFISTLSAAAAQRQNHMITSEPATPKRRIPVFRATGEAAARLQALPNVRTAPQPQLLQFQ